MSSLAEPIKILVVEDNEDVRNIVTVYLRSKGFQVVEALDGRAGLDMVETERPDLVLFDVLLPKLDGIEAIKLLKKMPGGASLPIVMMSAILQHRDIQAELASLGISAFLQKPFQVRELLETINKALAQSRPHKAEQAAPVSARASSQVRAPRTSFSMARSTATLHSAPENDTSRPLLYRNPKLPERGTLSQLPMPGLIHAAFFANATGRMRVISGTTEKRIYFQNGFPVYAESSLPEETLGAYLMAQNRLTLEQHIQAQREMTMSGRQYGEVLLRLGYLGPHELFQLLEQHLAEKVVSSFAWTEGQFAFEAGDDWKDSVIVVRMKPGRIIIDGIMQHWTDAYVQSLAIMAATNQPFVREGAIYSDAQLALTTQEARIDQAIKRGGTVAQIAAITGDAQRAHKLLIAFYIMGRIGFRAQEVAAKKAAKDKPASLNPSQAIPPEVEPRGQILLSEYLKYRTSDYDKLLGWARGATAAEIEQAFQVRQKRYHPDAMVGINSSLIREKMEELYMRLHQARQTLLDPELRAQYLAELEQSSTPMLSARSRTGRYNALAATAERHAIDFEEGFSMLRNGDPKTALTLFSRAEKAEPKAKYQAFRIWTEYLLSVTSALSTEEQLQKVFSANTDEALLAFLLGNFYLKEKKTNEAIRWFEKALQIDPQHIDSARQLRLLRMRQNEEPSSLFNLKELFRKERS